MSTSTTKYLARAKISHWPKRRNCCYPLHDIAVNDQITTPLSGDAIIFCFERKQTIEILCCGHVFVNATNFAASHVNIISLTPFYICHELSKYSRSLPPTTLRIKAAEFNRFAISVSVIELGNTSCSLFETRVHLYYYYFLLFSYSKNFKSERNRNHFVVIFSIRQ